MARAGAHLCEERHRRCRRIAGKDVRQQRRRARAVVAAAAVAAVGVRREHERAGDDLRPAPAEVRPGKGPDQECRPRGEEPLPLAVALGRVHHLRLRRAQAGAAAFSRAQLQARGALKPTTGVGHLAALHPGRERTARKLRMPVRCRLPGTGAGVWRPRRRGSCASAWRPCPPRCRGGRARPRCGPRPTGNGKNRSSAIWLSAAGSCASLKLSLFSQS